MKKILFIAIVFCLSIVSFYIIKNVKTNGIKIGKTIYVEKNAAYLESRFRWILNRLKDPETGKIPEGIRRKELEFAKTLPNDSEKGLKSSGTWVNRGPFNVGGRTRAMALDVERTSTILAGGVSGGMWRSTNSGQTWAKVTGDEQLHSVTCITQDTRAGKTNNWYYGTGEIYGNSAGESFTAFYFGDGIYKSSDNGMSWSPIEATLSNTPQIGTDFDLTWNIAINNAVDTADIIYAALKGKITRSTDGGETWTQVLGGGAVQSYFTDVKITSDGVVYAALSDEGDKKGIWRSANGIDWTNIMPSSFCSTYDRIVIGLNPSNENELYFFAVTPSCGQASYTFSNEYEYASLWKYTYETGDGAGTNGTWVNLTSNLPNNLESNFDNLNCQGSYNMVVSVQPGNNDVVILGGTNLYRSTDGFTSQNNTKQIGGYKPGTNFPDFKIYENHHPDQHVLAFLPSNSNVLFSATDGGVFKTSDCLAENVVWESLNQGYLTTQVYALSIDENNENDVIIAGFQDNGNFYVNSSDPTSSWVMPLNGDGSFSAISSDGGTYYMSIQNGKIFKMTLDNGGLPTAFARIDPIGGESYQFINPFVIDPNNDNVMYVSAGSKIWRNDSLTYIPLAGNYDSISTGWFKMGVVGNYNSTEISALAVSKNPANKLFYGTIARKVFRVDSANTGDPIHTRINDSIIFPNSNVSCIAVDPRDADKIMITYSNYNTYSLFYTENGGKWWNKVGGNLEYNIYGTGNGPSCRWASIIPVGDSTIYYVATSTGLYYTYHIQADSTEWTNVSSIGNVVTEMIKFRESDGLVVVGTHGGGIYSTKLSDNAINNQVSDNQYVNLFPNPANGVINLEFNATETPEKVLILDINGKVIKSILHISKIQKIDLMNIPQGVYFCISQFKTHKEINKFVILK